MTTSSRAVRSPLLPAVILLTAMWSSSSYARQENANDGFIFFTSDRAFPSLAGMCHNCEDIYVMAPDGAGASPEGTNVIRLTFGGGLANDTTAYNSTAVDWSHSRKLVAFQSNRINRIPQIFLMNADGGDPQLLVSLPGGASFPSFSQSGNEICLHSQTMPRDIYTVNLHGTGLTNLTTPDRLPGQPGLNGDNIRCDWSAKGQVIAFTSNRDGNQEIYVMDADGTRLRRLTTAEGNDANPAFSPRGDLIAFESNRDGTPEIYVMKADGSDQERLTNFSAEPTPSNVSVTKPTWSPTGDRIAFHRRVGAEGARGHLEVYTMNADGTNLSQITVTTPPGFSGFPSWGKWSAR
jgi:TolB protein